MKLDMEKLQQEYALQKAAEKVVVDTLLAKGEFLDEDGYPTSDALTIVELWPFEDQKGWFLFIESLWYMKSWGWSEGDTIRTDSYAPKHVYEYNISTAGWSGNEAIIRSMEENDALWYMTWVQSCSGGHYIFEMELE